MAALMVLFNYIKDGISCLDDNTTLLNTSIFLLKLRVTSQINRVRTYTTTIMMALIRSGKVTGRGLKVRTYEHWKKSKARQSTSTFT